MRQLTLYHWLMVHGISIIMSISHFPLSRIILPPSYTSPFGLTQFATTTTPAHSTVRFRAKRQNRHAAAELLAANQKTVGVLTPCIKHSDLDPSLVETYPALLMDIEQSTERHLCQGHCQPAGYITEKEYVQRLDIIESPSHKQPQQPKCANIERRNMYELPKYKIQCTGGGGGGVGGGGGTGVPSVYFELEHQRDGSRLTQGPARTSSENSA